MAVPQVGGVSTRPVIDRNPSVPHEEQAMCHACNRRQFLETTAAGGTVLAGPTSGAIGSQVGRIANPSYEPRKPGPVKIHVAYAVLRTRPGPGRTWTSMRNGSCLRSVWPKWKRSSPACAWRRAGRDGGRGCCRRCEVERCPTALDHPSHVGHRQSPKPACGCRLAHGDLRPALQRPRVDVVPAWQKAGKRVVLLPSERLRRAGHRRGPIAGPRPDAAVARPADRGARRHAGRVLGGAVKKRLGTEIVPITVRA